TMALIYSTSYLNGALGEEKYYAILFVMTAAMIGLACSADLFNLWVWFETLTVSSYLLVMFHRNQSLEAGLKYLVQSAIGSALVLLGIALVLMQTGTLALTEIKPLATPDPLLLVAGALVVIGFGVKIAFVPLHTWLPDAHSQAPSSISALLSGIVIEVALIALLRVLAALSGVTLTWGALLLGFGAVNMLGGNLLALRQTQVKRLLAYSSISHVGYMLLGFGIGIASGELAGAQGGFFHLVNHGLMKALAFLAAGALLYALNRHTLTLNDLAGASRRYPLVALAFSLSLLSLSGLPPLAGFMSKWQIFSAGFATQNDAVILLVIFAALNSVLSLAYYMPIINRLYRQKLALSIESGRTLPVTMIAPIVILAVIIIVIGIFPDVLNGLTEPAGRALIAAFGG
ncbi:MAG: hypothetical protein KC519_15455, partial [Anaerolineae bacterium]|nr:hypothetical protein [Anaerolineae bacterium]